MTHEAGGVDRTNTRYRRPGSTVLSERGASALAMRVFSLSEEVGTVWRRILRAHRGSDHALLRRPFNRVLRNEEISPVRAEPALLKSMRDPNDCLAAGGPFVGVFGVRAPPTAMVGLWGDPPFNQYHV